MRSPGLIVTAHARFGRVARSRHAMATPEVPRRDLAWQGGGRVTSGPSEVAQGPT